MPTNLYTVYVPYYNPAAVYGVWPYPDYAPYYFPPPPGYFYDQAFIGFGIGIAVIAPLWGWENWDWHHHRIDIEPRHFESLGGNRAAIASGAWRHDPVHRDGVPYPNAELRERFLGANASSLEAHQGFRGYVPEESERSFSAGAAVRRRPTASAPAIQRSAPPVFESFSRGADTQAYSARGLSSRREAGAIVHGDGGHVGGERGGDGGMRR